MTAFSQIGRGAAIAIFLSALAGTAGATIIDCERTRISKAGFRTLKDAKTMFPEKVAYQVVGLDARSDYYGAGSARKDGDKTVLEFPIQFKNGETVTMRVVWTPNTGRYSARYASGARYVQVTGAGGVCKVRK